MGTAKRFRQTRGGEAKGETPVQRWEVEVPPKDAGVDEREFKRRVRELGLGKFDEIVTSVRGHLSSEKEGLTSEAVRHALDSLATEKTDITGTETTQIGALEIAKGEWGIEGGDLRDEYLLPLVRKNLGIAPPE